MDQFSSLGSGVSMLLTAVLVIIGILYVLSIIYVVKDAHMRSDNWIVWGIVSLVPLIGFIAYIVMRPSLTTEDRDEQELELALKRRQLMRYGNCPHCGYPVESDYILCPHCNNRLKNLCPNCRHALNPEWSVCPYCATTIHPGGATPPQNTGATRRSSRTSAGGTETHRRAR